MSKEDLKKMVLDEKVFGPICDGAFQKADLDNSGFIDKKELKIVMTEMWTDLKCLPPTNAMVEKEMKSLDTNKDGKISKEEFRTLVKEILIASIDAQ